MFKEHLGEILERVDGARMAALIGPAHTKMVLMAGQKITADEALSYGLIDRICAPDALISTAQSLCEDICAAPPGHGAAIKAMCNRPALN